MMNDSKWFIARVMMQRSNWKSGSPCSALDLIQLTQYATIKLPSEYLAHLNGSDGGFGALPVQPWHIQFWEASEVQALNEGYEVSANIPGFYAFASSGGGEMFAFDSRGKEPWPIVIIPFIPMVVNEAISVAPDFAAFRRMLGVSVDDGWNGFGSP